MNEKKWSHSWDRLRCTSNVRACWPRCQVLPAGLVPWTGNKWTLHIRRRSKSHRCRLRCRTRRHRRTAERGVCPVESPPSCTFSPSCWLLYGPVDTDPDTWPALASGVMNLAPEIFNFFLCKCVQAIRSCQTHHIVVEALKLLIWQFFVYYPADSKVTRCLSCSVGREIIKERDVSNGNTQQDRQSIVLDAPIVNNSTNDRIDCDPHHYSYGTIYRSILFNSALCLRLFSTKNAATTHRKSGE